MQIKLSALTILGSKTNQSRVPENVLVGSVGAKIPLSNRVNSLEFYLIPPDIKFKHHVEIFASD